MAEGGFGPDFQIFEIDHAASLPFAAAKESSKMKPAAIMSRRVSCVPPMGC
jgi:hypothetical protein